MDMRRKIYSQLADWKENSNGRSALLIEGARRIGKSYIVEQFAKHEYKSYILIDFNNVKAEIKNLFVNYLTDLDTFFQLLSLHTNKPLYHRESVIIFDEVQQFPPARAAIKYLVADGRYDYIETGSLISIKKNVQNIVIPSEEQHLSMYPMDFDEFLWAMGENTLCDYLHECFRNRKMVGTLHRKTMELFRLYLIIGGMPQAVTTYINTHDFRQVESLKQSILQLYRADIHKYATGSESKAAAVFEAIPSQLQLHENRFVLSDLDPNARFRNYESAFFWLHDSRIVNIAYNTFAPTIGLHMNTERRTLRCYMADTGLLISLAFSERGQMPVEIYEKLLHDKLEVNLGMVMENVVAQMLASSGNHLFFYNHIDREDAANDMEIDFLITKSRITSRKNISPIEVKSSTHFTTTSLNKCMTKFSQAIGEAYVLHTNDIQEDGKIIYLPLYMAGYL